MTIDFETMVKALTAHFAATVPIEKLFETLTTAYGDIDKLRFGLTVDRVEVNAADEVGETAFERSRSLSNAPRFVYLPCSVHHHTPTSS